MFWALCRNRQRKRSRSIIRRIARRPPQAAVIELTKYRRWTRCALLHETLQGPRLWVRQEPCAPALGRRPRLKAGRPDLTGQEALWRVRQRALSSHSKDLRRRASSSKRRFRDASGDAFSIRQDSRCRLCVFRSRGDSTPFAMQLYRHLILVR